MSRTLLRLMLAAWFFGGVSGNAQPPATNKEAGEPVEAAPAVATVSAVAEIPAIVKVNATLQAYQPLRPWMKTSAVDRRGLGVVIGKQGVLVSSEMIADATYVEIELADSGVKWAASVVVADHSANLALIRPSDEAALKGIEALGLREVTAGEKVDICQLERTGAVLKTQGVVTTLEVDSYPAADISLLIARVACSLQFREASFVVPVMAGNRLAGLMMRYNARTQDAEVIPVPVIKHFLADADNERYYGFPRLGVGFSPMRDPQFRAWANVPDGSSGGVYLRSVEPGSPAAAGGLKPGDLLVEVAGRKIDRDGNYQDPRYGKTGISHLIAAGHRHGDQITCVVIRSGKRESLKVTVAEKQASDWVIPPYTFGRAPRYHVLGGLVFLELSRTYLQQWRDWKKTAPRRFLYMEEYQSELFSGDDRERIVVLSQVLPSELTVGYEDLGQLTVSSFNGIRLKSIADIEKAVENPVEGMHRIEFEEEPYRIYLDAGRAIEIEEALKRSYGIRELKRL